MSDHDSFAERGRALEEEYFRKKDRELIEKLRRASEVDQARGELSKETGLTDPAMLACTAGIGPYCGHRLALAAGSGRRARVGRRRHHARRTAAGAVAGEKPGHYRGKRGRRSAEFLDGFAADAAAVCESDTRHVRAARLRRSRCEGFDRRSAREVLRADRVCVWWSFRSAFSGDFDGGAQPADPDRQRFERAEEVRRDQGSKALDPRSPQFYRDTSPVLSPNLSVGISSVSSIATSRFAIGVFFG